MRVLFFAPYIYDETRPEFSKTSSGFGYMVNDILRGVSEENEVYLATHQFSAGYRDTYTACRHTKGDFLKGINKKNIKDGIRDFFSKGVSFNNRLHFLYYQLDEGSIENIVNRVNPDIIHIHGLTFQTKAIIDFCMKRNFKFIVTLHGLNGLDNSVNLPKVEKDYEYYGLKKFEDNHITVTVVSSGIKKRIVENYSLSGNNIKVILNGTSFNSIDRDTQVRKEHEKYNILCVGTVSERKNQIQLIRACALLPQNVKDKVRVFVVGGNATQMDVQDEISKRGLSEIIRYCGFVPREKMTSLWEKADLNVVMSKSEGFGLSMIEGFAYGVPTLTFGDIDALIDLYDEKEMEIIPDRSDKSVATSIEESLGKSWDHQYIKAMSRKYSLKNICEQYNMLYKAEIEKK